MTAPNSSEGTEHPTTSSLKAADIALSDPLRPETRKARLYLLGVSMVGITIVYTGLVPQEITTLGITFGEADRQSLLGILALVTLYFLATFATYGVSDFIYWQRAYRNAQWSEVRQITVEAGDMARQIMTEAAAPLGQAEEVRPEVSKDMKKEMEKKVKEIEETLRGMTLAQANDFIAGFNAATSGGGDFEVTSSPDERAIMRYSALSPSVASVRALIEFLLPLLVGLFAIYALVGPTAFGALIAGVATVAAALWLRVYVHRRRTMIRPGKTATQAATEAAIEAPTEGATKAASQVASQIAQRPTEAVTEEGPEKPPQEQPRDK